MRVTFGHGLARLTKREVMLQYVCLIESPDLGFARRTFAVHTQGTRRASQRG